MLESICGWEKLDNRRGFRSDRQRLISAISGLAAVRQPKDMIGWTLPDTDDCDGSYRAHCRRYLAA